MTKKKKEQPLVEKRENYIIMWTNEAKEEFFVEQPTLEKAIEFIKENRNLNRNEYILYAKLDF